MGVEKNGEDQLDRERVRNEEVLRRVGEQRTLINTMHLEKKSTMDWAYHTIIRTAENSHRRKSKREKTERKEEEDDVG